MSRRHHHSHHHYHSRRHSHKPSFRPRRRGKLFGIIPYHITFSIILIILGILVLRFTPLIFFKWFNWTEGIFWGFLIGSLLIIAGLLMIIAYWRNHVSRFTTRHSVRFR